MVGGRGTQKGKEQGLREGANNNFPRIPVRRRGWCSANTEKGRLNQVERDA